MTIILNRIQIGIHKILPQMPKNKKTKTKPNKWPMGHIAHLSNQFKSINTFQKSYDNTITLIRENSFPNRELNSPYS